MMCDRLLIDKKQYNRVGTKFVVAVRYSLFEKESSNSFSKSADLPSYVTMNEEPLNDESSLRHMLGIEKSFCFSESRKIRLFSSLLLKNTAAPHQYTISSLPSNSSTFYKTNRAAMTRRLLHLTTRLITQLLPGWPTDIDAINTAPSLDVGVRGLGVSVSHFVDIQENSIVKMFASLPNKKQTKNDDNNNINNNNNGGGGGSSSSNTNTIQSHSNSSTLNQQSPQSTTPTIISTSSAPNNRIINKKRSLPRLINDEFVCLQCAARFDTQKALDIHTDAHFAMSLSKQINSNAATNTPSSSRKPSNSKRKHSSSSNENKTLLNFFSKKTKHQQK